MAVKELKTSFKHGISVIMALFLCTDIAVGQKSDGDLQSGNISSTFIGTDPLTSDLIYVNSSINENSQGLRSFLLSTSKAGMAVSEESLEDAAKLYISSFQENLGLSLSPGQLQLNKNFESSNGAKHLTFQQLVNGIPVRGGEVRVHFKASGAFESMNGSFSNSKPNYRTANINADQGIFRAKEHVSSIAKAYYFNDVQKKMMNYEGPKASLMYFNQNDELILCWYVDYKPNFTEHWEVLVSATTGEILMAGDLGCQADGPKTSNRGTSVNGRKNATKIHTYKKGETFYLIDASRDMFKANAGFTPESPDGGVIVTYDAGRNAKNALPNNSFKSSLNEFGSNMEEQAAVSAQTNAGLFYEELKKAPFNYQSLDGKGGDIVMYVNVKDDYRDFLIDNAKWEGNYVLFGGGDETDGTRDFGSSASKSLDVVVHELMHGISQYSYGPSTHSYQTRALSEAISDIMAIAIEGNFRIGEDADIRNGAGYIRNAKDPHAAGASSNDWDEQLRSGYSANHMNEFIDAFGASHFNSTIISHAFYLIAGEEQGDGLGLRDASDIFFHVVTEELLASSEFDDFVKLFIKVAENKYGQGSNSPQIKRIIQSFNQVGLATPIVKIEPGDLPSLTGNHFLFSHSAESAVNGELVLSEIMDGDSAISKDNTFSDAVNLVESPSVTDNGEIIYGVDVNGHIQQIDRSDGIRVKDASTHDQFDLGTGYSYVAVSSKNERLGLVKSQNDPAIYVYDVKRKLTRRFSIEGAISSVEHNDDELYRLKPVQIGNLEWDYFGTKLIFEYQSSFETKTGEEHFVWNIGEVEVWDSLASDFGPGELHIFQQFSGSEINRRNPAYSKNSTSLFIYDLFNSESQTNKVIAWNREGTEGLPVMTEVIETKVLAHATYTHTDTALIITDLDDAGKPALYLIDLMGDKVTVQSHTEPIKILGGEDMLDPLWFTMGTRTSLPPAPKDIKTLNVYPNPFNDQIVIDLPNAQFQIVDLVGKTLLDGIIPPTGVLNVGDLPVGSYVLHITSENRISAQIITKE